LDQLLQAHRRQSEAESGYYSSVIDYNLAIMTLHYRKGSLLEYNNVCLTEGPWPGKAYYDAKRRARERAAGHYFNYGYTLPEDVSKGTYRQHQHGYNSAVYEELPKTPPAPSLAPPVMDIDSSPMLPAPILPRSVPSAFEDNTPVSFITEDALPSTLTPSRNMHYVR
jgi:hypothetical protein